MGLTSPKTTSRLCLKSSAPSCFYIFPFSFSVLASSGSRKGRDSFQSKSLKAKKDVLSLPKVSQKGKWACYLVESFTPVRQMFDGVRLPLSGICRARVRVRACVSAYEGGGGEGVTTQTSRTALPRPPYQHPCPLRSFRQLIS